jgi:hypothetical protein
VIQQLEAKRLAIRSFGFRGDTQLITPTQELYGSHVILGQYPNRIRAELVGPFGRPVLTLVCDGTFLTALDMNKNKAYTGLASRRNLARFLGIRLSAAEIYALLSGSLYLDKIKQAETLAQHDGAYMIMVQPAQGKGSLRLLVDPDLNAIKQAWHTKPGGSGDWDDAGLKIKFSDFENAGGFELPGKARVTDENRRTLTLDHDEIVINRTLDKNLFSLDIPLGFPIMALP